MPLGLDSLKPDRSELYEDEAGEWRWVRTAPNGETVGASTEGYVSPYHCRENYSRVNGVGAPELVLRPA